MQRGSLRLPANSQFHLIIARQCQRALGTCSRIKRAWDLNWIIVAQVPCKPVHSFVGWNRLHPLDAVRPFGWLLAFLFFFAGKVPDHFARSIKDIERDFLFWCGLKIISDDCARRRVVTHWLAFIEFLRVM